MTTDITSIIILVVAAGLGSIAGYWGRIAQKLEDAKDKVCLTELPAIYADTRAIGDSLSLFQQGTSIDKLSKTLEAPCKDLGEKISSGNILVFRKEFYPKVYQFYRDLQTLQAMVEGVIGDADKENISTQFRAAFSKNEPFPYGDLSIKPKEILAENEAINADLAGEFKRYHSYSWRLTLMIFGLGVFVAAIEIAKDYFS